MKTRKRSLIQKYFPPELYLELMKVTMMYDLDNNSKGNIIKSILDKNSDYPVHYPVDFYPLGSGTNRLGLLIDGYAFKFALDADGMIDNRREMLYTKNLQPYAIKVYECMPNGLVANSEYIQAFTLDEFRRHKDEMREILAMVSEQFLIGDVGITDKNYGNWGIKPDGQIAMLDFAYIYNVKYNLFSCSCSDDSMLIYDDDFVNLTCNRCGRKYTFADLRKRITRKQQEDEIGDIRRLSYNITKEFEEVELVPEFEPPKIQAKHDKEMKKLSPREQIAYDYKQEQKRKKKEKEEAKLRELEEEETNRPRMSMDEVIDSI